MYMLFHTHKIEQWYANGKTVGCSVNSQAMISNLSHRNNKAIDIKIFFFLLKKKLQYYI